MRRAVAADGGQPGEAAGRDAAPARRCSTPPRGLLEEWAAHLARYHPRLLAADRAIERVRRSDPDAVAHRARVHAAKLAGCRRVMARLEEEGRLAPPWTTRTAADMLYALSTSDVVERLLADRGWSRRALAQRLGALLRATFVRGEGGGAGAGAGG